MIDAALRAFFEHPGAMRGVVELIGDDLRCVMVNSAAAESFGMTPEEMAGRTLSDLGVSARQRLEWIDRLQASHNSGRPVSFGYSYERAGQPHALRAVVNYIPGAGAVPQFTFTADDVTAVRSTEAAARRAEESYATLVRNFAGAVYRTPRATHTQLEFISDNCYDITGYPPDELIGDAVTSLDALIHASDVVAVRSRYATELSSRNECSVEYRIVHRDGRTRWIWDRARAVYASDGALLYVEGLLTDITARREDAEERQALREQLLHMQRVDLVGKLAGGVAHDFNNLLAVILGHAELLRSQMADDDPLAESVAEIRSASDRSVHLTRQLLGFARRQSIAPQVVDLNDVVAAILRLLRRLIGEGVDLRWIPDAATWRVRIDPTQLDQVLTNLCVNARDAMRGSGHIAISTRNVVLDAAFARTHEGARVGEFALLRVEDNGSGMKPDVLARVFEPFFTTKQRDQGTGLGLATVYGIVKQNEGYIGIDSVPGKGTTVSVYLPRYAEVTDEESGLADVDADMPRGTETILLVEDEPALLRITGRVLSTLGYSVLSAATTNDAVRQVMTNLDRVDLLVTDIVLPGMNGRRLADFLQAQKPGLAVLFMSGYPDTAFDGGVVPADIHFIAKPFTPQQLAQKVREAIAESPRGEPLQ